MAFWTTPEVGELGDAGRWDAEAFSPTLRLLDSKFRDCERLSALATVTHPSEIIRNYSDADDAKLFLLAQNIRPILPDTSTEFRIPSEVAAKIPTNRLLHGDVLVTRSGANSGMCAVYLGKNGECYTSGEGLIVRSRGHIDGAYLATFFSTSFGQALSQRAIYGSGQPHIGPKYLERAFVPRLGAVEEKASKLVRLAYGRLKRGETLYPEAEAELLDRLEWDRFRPNELSYVCNFADLTRAARSDAEHFQPQWVRLAEKLKEGGSQFISEFCPKPTRGVQPHLIESADVVVIDSKAVRAQGVEPAIGERTSREFRALPANAKARVRRGDVLLNSTGRGTLGRAACYQLKAPAICDNHVAIIRPDPEVCDPIYLALFLNSPAGLAQSEQYQTGSSGQLEIYPEHIQKFLVYLPRQKNGQVDIAWQKRVAAKVKGATAAKVAARGMLEKAKRMVEEALRKYKL